MSDILDRLQPVFRSVLDNPSLTVSRTSSGENVAGWDSFAHVMIVSAIEDEFGVRFALGELETLQNVGDMVDLIAAKLGVR